MIRLEGKGGLFVWKNRLRRKFRTDENDYTLKSALFSKMF